VPRATRSRAIPDQDAVRLVEHHGVGGARAASTNHWRSARNWLVAIGAFFLLQQALWPAPLGIVVHGIEIGGLIALVSFGLALIYQANKIINFAQVDLGGPPTVLGFLLISQGWPFWPAFVVSLVLGTLLGIGIQVGVMRRFFRSPRLVATVVTIGISQVLQGIAALLPNYLTGNVTVNANSNAAPFDLVFHINSVIFNGNDVLAIVAVPAMALGLVIFLRYTNIGAAIRASADNADRASLLGINVLRIQIVVWAVAGLLATVGVFLTASIEGGVGVAGTYGGPELLVQALAAAVIGRLERFGTMFAAAAAIGVLEQAIIWSTSSAQLVDPICFVVIVVALLVQRRGASSRHEMGWVSTWQAIGNVRPTPAPLARLPEVVWGRRALLALVGAVAIALPWLLSPGKTNLACLVLIFAIVAISVVIVTGWSGQISLGQVGFMGIGAGVGAAIALHWHWDLVWIVIVAGVVGALAAMVIGIPALRIQGLFLAVVTLAFSLVVGSYLLDPSVVHWLPTTTDFLSHPYALGRVVDSQRAYYGACLVVLVLAIGAAWGIRQSRTGRALMAVRDNPSAAESYGINRTRTRLTAFAISGFLAAAAGALFVFNQQALDAAQFQVTDSLGAFAGAVVGGLGSVTGGIIGSIYYNGIQWFQTMFPTALRSAVNLLASGFGLIVILAILPNGLAALPFRLRDAAFRRIALRRGLNVESITGPAAPARHARRTLKEELTRRATTRVNARRRTRDRAETPAASGASLLEVSGLDVGYDGVQVLFGVDAEVHEGEIVALLGTNGAGKSTLLRAISGIQAPVRGSVLYQGCDLAKVPPHEIAAMGLVHMPGGRGVFPSLTVSENVRIAGWLTRRDHREVARRTANALSLFPHLQSRLDLPAVSLSGGEQQMLMLAQTLMLAPRLVMIDELSLGLSPLVVDSLTRAVQTMRESGTTFLLVEQSVNVALTVADRAYFMEKGEIRFQGDAAALLERPDILRSVFIAGAEAYDTTAETSRADSVDHSPAALTSKVPAMPSRRSSQLQPVRPALEVTGLTRSFGGIRAVSDLSVTLHQGEILGIIGPNGAGKTTLFDLIGGSTVPEEGRIVLRGNDITRLGPDVRARLGLGRSFQDARLFSGLTVAQTIAVSFECSVAERDPIAAALHLPAVVESESELAEKVDSLIELLGLEGLRDRFISELSTGTRRIVDLACTLAHEPSVLLMDEPSSGIAQRETEALGPFVRRIRDDTGCAILIIEHDMPLICSVADELIAMELGDILLQGSPADVLNDDRVISSYIGTSSETINRSGSRSM
jgi:ABC-type branched-subunit amino acid transport system ATPase component/ABC-type branched-subunit amino acid transport system permease subunit